MVTESAGQILRRFRTAAGLTMKDLERLSRQRGAPMSYGVIYKAEKGRTLTDATLERYRELVGLTDAQVDEVNAARDAAPAPADTVEGPDAELWALVERMRRKLKKLEHRTERLQGLLDGLYRLHAEGHTHAQSEGETAEKVWIVDRRRRGGSVR